MRYSVYKFIKELGESMLEAVTYVKEHKDNVSVLNDCIDAMFSIKSSLDAESDIDKDITDTVDKFFSVMECIVNKCNNNETCNNEVDELYSIVSDINKFILTKLKYKFKIVFFAELGAKWDSMDSVYRAMKERTDCEVQVVIAPIFRAVKEPNGKIKSDVIYEDFLTPMGISHIPFKNYDIKKDLPDITFTSQPYESVTTEMFWAENIAPYTHLVYLPYFTAGNALTKEDIYVQCQMPMHQLAWKVICQSEKVKEFYSKYSPTKGENIIATGLPKWDYVVNMDKRDIKMPDEWAKLKGKTVMLINVHYNMGENIDRFFESMRASLKTNIDAGCGVIYRFHPMLETMFNVYHLDYKSEWVKLLEEIKQTTNCVVDMEVAYDSAFKFSDMLISGPSSIVAQYLLTKKPVIFRGDNYNELDEDSIFLSYSKLGVAASPDEANKIKVDLINNKDTFKENRLKLIEEGLPEADGHIGERIVNILLNDLLSEN